MTGKHNIKVPYKPNSVKPVLLTACVVFVSAISTASFGYDVVSTEISLSTLSTPQGVSRTYSSLASKAENICNDQASIHYQIFINQSECVSDILDQFIADVANPALSAYHAAK